jgi:glycosyltransferase involved in cell wall biosynthesis
VNRQVRFLREHHEVTTIGLGRSGLDDVSHLSVQPPARTIGGKCVTARDMLLRRYERCYWRFGYAASCMSRLQEVDFDLVLANNPSSWPAAVRAAERAGKVLFDAHEYFPRQFEDQLRSRLFYTGYRTHLCRKYIPRADAMTTVCDGIAEAYGQHFGCRPRVITNAPVYEDRAPNIQPSRTPSIRMIHHGAAEPSRRIESMLETKRLLGSRFRLDLLLVPGSTRYIRELKSTFGADPGVRFLDPVPMEELVSVCSQYDIGFFLLEPTGFSYLHALPNKFFEYIQARLAVAIGPSPEMARIVRKEGCGVVAESFHPESMAKVLASLDHDQLNRFKQQSHRIARTYSADANREALLELVETLIA